MRAAGRTPVYADCNAVAPQTKREIAALIGAAGARFIDVGIIGPPPRGDTNVRLYAAGPDAGLLAAIKHPQVTVRVVSERIGDAAAVKMCYGAVTKGMIAMGTELMVASRRLGIAEALEAELAHSQSAVRDWLFRQLPSMPPKAYRWVPETREIAATFGAVGLTPRTMLGAADLYESIAATPLGRESPEQARDAKRSPTTVLDLLAAPEK